MSDFRYHERFLGLDDESSNPTTSTAWVLPVPFEMTTSYAGGTKLGPAAIIEASNQVEIYDPEVNSEAGVLYGIYTLPYFHPTMSSSAEAISSITTVVQGLELDDRVLVTLGGEHSITPGVVAALAPRYPDLIVVQIDAHADLRHSYEGTLYSHACAARRILDYAPVLQLGIRSMCQEEVSFSRTSDRVTIFTAEEIYRDREHNYLQALALAVAGRPVYLTIDVDGLDPAIIPATGTPEPGGLGWYTCLDILRTTVKHGNVIAFDCVELAPTLGGPASPFAAAKLVYKTLNYVMQARGKVG